jgi:rRNA-processing protein FCF1
MASNRIWRNRKEKIVILDSNALMMLFEYSINLDEELKRLVGLHKIIIPNFIIRELKSISEKGQGHKKIVAKPALKLAKKFSIYNVKTDKNGDDAILELAETLSAIVVTNDKELKRRLKNKSILTIILRNKSHLIVE